MIEGVVLQSAGGTITALNQAAERILGDAGESITGRTWASLPWPIICEDGTAFPAEQHPANVAVRTGEPQSGVVMGLCRTEDVVTWISVNAHPLPPSADDPSGRRSPTETAVVTTFHDITEQKEQAAHFERMASHDTLTGLANRLLLSDRLNQAIARTQRSARQIAVCYLDLDGFKQVNDRFGHEAGDRLLVEVTRRLLDCVRGSDTVARLGGDEFVVLLTDLLDEGECIRVLERLLASVAAPFRLDDGQRVEISASIGATLFPKDEADADTLMRHADRAMYDAKRSGGNRYRQFGVS
jgi:diguanylate cyclase (GGDEF)-like protein